jgi:hypothetical protein
MESGCHLKNGTVNEKNGKSGGTLNKILTVSLLNYLKKK